MSLIDINNKKTKIDDYRNDLSLFAKELPDQFLADYFKK